MTLVLLLQPQPDIEMQYHPVPTSFGPVFVPVPNRVTQAAGFYVSYNDHDTSIYGSDTTALVLGQMERFYILKGDHRQAYAKLIPCGFEACLSYFKCNFDQAHPYSDKLPA